MARKVSTPSWFGSSGELYMSVHQLKNFLTFFMVKPFKPFFLKKKTFLGIYKNLAKTGKNP